VVSNASRQYIYILFLCMICSKFIFKTVALIWIITIFYYTMLLKFTENALTLALKSIGILKGPERLRWHVLAASCLNFYGQVRFWMSLTLQFILALPASSTAGGLQ
jgi:hypothetical protein